MTSREEELFTEQCDANYKRTDRMFAMLMFAQWVFGIVLALGVSPYAWSGRVHTTHLHVWVAIFLGGAISSLPMALAFLQPGTFLTRAVIACGQMLWSALLIHLTGGRIETHFHVFGSLAFLAFYRDWRVLVPATVVVAADHLLRQLFWPESVFGIVSPEWWRFLEHAGWVIFIDLFLVLACVTAVRDMHAIAKNRADVEASRDAIVRTEKLAAVGQLAASVGHELRNPLAAVRNAHAYITKKLGSDKPPAELIADPRLKQFLGLMDRELASMAKIITDLLEFARERPLTRGPCPLGPLVVEAVSLVPEKANVRISNDVPEDLPVPNLDKEQFRQIIINLVQNATEAIPDGRTGEVHITAAGGDGKPWRVAVKDNGSGIAKDVIDKIFEPLFTTKVKGTGLGLAIVASMVKRHGGTLSANSEIGRGTEMIIELPQAS